MRSAAAAAAAVVAVVAVVLVVAAVVVVDVLVVICDAACYNPHTPNRNHPPKQLPHFGSLHHE